MLKHELFRSNAINFNYLPCHLNGRTTQHVWHHPFQMTKTYNTWALYSVYIFDYALLKSTSLHFFFYFLHSIWSEMWN